MTDSDAFGTARDELYGLDPEQFLERRAQLAAQAKAAGDALAAKRIGALRKPTRPAYAVNRLVRARPESADQLAALGDNLRAAQRALDAAQIREVSEQRNRLIAELADAAIRAAQIKAASVALRDEITGTLIAALADEDVLDELRTGAMVRPARWDGFGADLGPSLSLVPAPTPIRPVKSAPRKDADKPSRVDTLAAQAGERKQAKIAELEQRVDDATEAARGADQALAEHQREVRLIERRLTEANRRTDDLRLDVKVAQRELKSAQDALDRARR